MKKIQPQNRVAPLVGSQAHLQHDVVSKQIQPVTKFRKGFSEELKRLGVTPAQAKELKTAVVEISTFPLEKLHAGGKTLQLKVKGKDNVYAYKINKRKKMIFTEESGNRFVHEIVDMDKLK